MKTLSQLLQLSILLPIWGTLFAMILLLEVVNRAGRNGQARLSQLRMAVGNDGSKPVRPEVRLTASAAQV